MGGIQVRVSDAEPVLKVSSLRSWRQLLVLPSLAGVVVFFLIPLGLILAYSFAQIDLITYDIRFAWTLENYRALADPLYFHTLLRSILLSLGTTVGCLLVGFPLAYFISRQPAKVQRLLLVLVLVPFWTSFVVRAYSIETLLQNDGPIDRLLHAAGIIHGSLNVLYTPWAIAIGIIYSYLPTMVLPIFVGLQRIQNDVLEGAADLGARPHRAFRRVTLPLAMPGVVVGCLIVGIPAMGEYVIPEILGGGKTLMLGNVITAQFLDVGNLTFGSAIAVALVAALSLVLLARKYIRPLEAG
jgi:ABC-type spermidine/putrescine transport system permease subunit I